METALRRAAHWHRPLMVFVTAMAVLAVVCTVGLLVDDRVVAGAPIWLKPFKFSVSFVAFGLTLGWMLALLPARSRTAEWAATVLVAMAWLEMAIIVTQVVRGQASHYNETSPLNAVLWQAMGAVIMVLFAAHFVIGLALLRGRLADRTVRYAVGLGIGLSLLGMLVALPMTLPMSDPGIEGVAGAHSVGVPDGGAGLPVTGWSTEGGDLRIGHFVGLHGLQALPLLALLLTRYARRCDEATRSRLVLVAGAGYAALTLLLTWQALRGQPLLRPDLLTLGALAALVAGTVAAVAAVLSAARRPSPAPVTEAGTRDGMLVG